MRDALAVTAADADAEHATRFDWRRTWYPVAQLESLEASTVPSAVTVLGERIALWRDAGGAWRALRDLCPHRLAPLSAGRVAEDGTLQAR